jgi:hypothetical protein
MDAEMVEPSRTGYPARRGTPVSTRDLAATSTLVAVVVHELRRHASVPVPLPSKRAEGELSFGEARDRQRRRRRRDVLALDDRRNLLSEFVDT